MFALFCFAFAVQCSFLPNFVVLIHKLEIEVCIMLVVNLCVAIMFLIELAIYVYRITCILEKYEIQNCFSDSFTVCTCVVCFFYLQVRFFFCLSFLFCVFGVFGCHLCFLYLFGFFFVCFTHFDVWN